MAGLVGRRLGTAAAWLSDALVGSDPGLLRLRNGAVAALSVSLAVGLMVALAGLEDQPITAELLGIVLAMISSTLVRDVQRRDRMITSALLPVAAAATSTAAALLSPHAWAATAGFVVVMFLAAYIRRFEARGTAVGMIGFIAYFYTLFLHAGPAQLPRLIIAATAGIACSLLVREFVLPERDSTVLARLVPAFRARVGAVLDATRAAVGDGELTDRADMRLRVRLRRLNETAQLIEERIERTGEQRLWPGLSNEALALRVFDLELATEEVALTAARWLKRPGPADEQRRLVRLLGVLRRSVREGAGISADALSAADRLAEAAEGRPAGALVKAIQMMARTIPRVRPDAEEEEPALDSAHDEEEPDETPAKGPEAAKDEAPAGRRWPTPRPTTRQAIQTAVAGGVAIVVGNWISPDRWYWAALTAFVVFLGTSSRGETLSRGGQRLLGTLGGVLAGVLVAAPLSGHHALSLALVVVCVFLAFYLQRVNQAFLALFITVLLALMYGLIGQFSVEVLALRLEETAIGAVSGVLASYLVLPISTRGTVRDKLAEFADQLGALIDQATDVLCGDRAGDGLITAARDLDAATSALRLAARPVSHGMAGVSGRRMMRGWVRAARACDQYGRELAQVCYPLGWIAPVPAALRPGEPGQADSVEVLRAGCALVREHLELLPAALTKSVGRPTGSAVPLFDEVLTRALTDPTNRALRHALHYLIRIDQTLLAALGNRASERLDQARN